MTIHIPPFWWGVTVTILFEVGLLITIAIIGATNKKGGKKQ